MEKIYTLDQIAERNQTMITDLNARKPKSYYEPIEQSTKRIIKLVENFNLMDNKHIIKRNGELYFDEVAEKIIYTYLSLNLPAGYNSVPQYPSKEEISENQYRDGKNLFKNLLYGEELFTLLKKQWQEWAKQNENYFNVLNLVTLYNCLDSTYKFYEELQKQYYKLLADYLKLEEEHIKLNNSFKELETEFLNTNKDCVGKIHTITGKEVEELSQEMLGLITKFLTKSKKRYVFQEKKSEENYKKNYDIEIF
ncbi:MAG: hypothetical protein IKN12_02590 [Selenomonadaceae bacterium]|nr:hypothetical protein [Selenomonadaceae bacterium]